MVEGKSVWFGSILKKKKVMTKSRMACRHSGVTRDESERHARTANQLISTSPITKKHSTDWQIRTERTESFSDWTKRVGATGFLTILNREA